MSAPAPPTVPPRPVKQQAASQGVSKPPEIPPRPIAKRLERSISPANYPASPLNEPYVPTVAKAPNPIPRAPSVSHLPAPGEEGMEYANIQYDSQDSPTGLEADAGAQTRTIAQDLQLHAPKPSLPKASATAQVQGVTRTDIGRSSHDDLTMTRTRSRQSFSRPDSAASGGNRRRSVVYDDEQGPAEIGLRVPINPLLGDVQAPTPAGMSPQVTGDSSRRHSRKKSGVEDFRPPDSYGLHGHGTIANTRFERDWYAKHPELLEHEEGRGHGVYEGIGSGRGSFALSSSELNKLVRDTASRGSGVGTSENTISYPEEHIGYIASEVYQQRSQQGTPLPEPLSGTNTRAVQPSLDSPLQRTSFPAEGAPTPEIRKSRASMSQASDDAEQEEAHHVDQPNRRYNKVTGGQESVNETQEAKPFASHLEDDGRDYTVPILAEDEVAKHGNEFQYPAVSPKFERRSSIQDEDQSGAQTPTSRPTSRPGSIYQSHSASHSLSRFLSHQDEREHMHTPLEDVAEYEPLFDENDEKKALTTTERFKRRPDVLQKRFPSQDIWEDTPSSAMHVAEVSTPDLPSQGDPSNAKGSGLGQASETPEAGAAREEEVSETERQKLIPKDERLAQPKFPSHLGEDMPTKNRPTVANRFPSQDIWEDTPDSSHLVTTVGSPQIEETSPVDTKPPVPVRPTKSRLGEGASPTQIEPGVAPAIPARPSKRVHAVPPADAKLTDPVQLSREISPTDLKKVPNVPDRPKPQIPPRPAKKPTDNGLTKTTSVGSNESTETQVPAKSKPQIPARPVGGNFANIKGNFMNDLNRKLGLGPRKEKEKEPEPEVEAKPLEDARKGRARGPQRRAPAKASAGEPKPIPQFSIFAAQPLWQIDEADELVTIIEPKLPAPSEVVSAKDHALNAEEPSKDAALPVDDKADDVPPPPQASELAKNTAGEPADPVPGEEDESLEGELTRKTTATTIDGEELDRAESAPTAHLLPASQQTTASDSDKTEEELEKAPTKEPEAKAEDELVKMRNEQVNASAPDHARQSASNIEPVNKGTPAESGGDAVHKVPSSSKGEEEAQEPMNEKDVDYGKLEEMTARADGKLTTEDPHAAFSSKKVVD